MYGPRRQHAASFRSCAVSIVKFCTIATLYMGLVTDLHPSIQFHAAILDLFRPFLCRQPNQPLQLGRFTAENRTPAAIYAASVNQLKHIILVFRTRFSCATTSLLWHNALLYVANACLPLQSSSHKGGQQSHSHSHSHSSQDYDQGLELTTIGTWGAGSGPQGDDDRRRVWFLACIAGYQDLAPRFHLVTKIVPGLLSLAILNRQMTAAEGRALMGQMKANIERTSRYGVRRHSDQLQDGASQLTRYPDGASRSTMVYQDGGASIDSLLDGTGPYGRSDLQISHIFAAPEIPEASRGGSPFVVDLNTASVDPSAASIDVLAQNFHELAMFDEFMIGEVANQQD